MKVVINRCYGGFGLSEEALIRLSEMGIPILPWDKDHHSESPVIYQGGLEHCNLWLDSDLERNDPRLVNVVEELGERANGPLSKLKVVEIPDDVEWEIDEYDGIETIDEVHRSWA